MSDLLLAVWLFHRFLKTQAPQLMLDKSVSAGLLKKRNLSLFFNCLFVPAFSGLIG